MVGAAGMACQDLFRTGAALGQSGKLPLVRNTLDAREGKHRSTIE